MQLLKDERHVSVLANVSYQVEYLQHFLRSCYDRLRSYYYYLNIILQSSYDHLAIIYMIILESFDDHII
jgi:hypothetical protein